MKAFIKWFLENCLITFGMMMTAAVIAGVYQTREINGADYQMLVEAWPNAHADLKAQIRESISGGRISRWTYTDLVRATIKDVGGISWKPGSDLEQEREKLLKLVKS